MTRYLHAYEMVEGTTPEEAALMKQQRRIEEAQRLRRQMQQITQQAPSARPDWTTP